MTRFTAGGDTPPRALKSAVAAPKRQWHELAPHAPSRPRSMQTTVSAQPEDWLLGADRKQRVRTRRTLVASAVYWLAALGQLWAAEIGLADPAMAQALVVFLAPGLVGFYLVMRLGLSLRLADPAMTMQQMVFAIVAMAAAYVINPPLRGMLLMIVALVLVFAAFMLSPKASRALGWLAVAVLGLVMLAMLPWFAGLLVVGPVLGHASWHAYREAVAD